MLRIKEKEQLLDLLQMMHEMHNEMHSLQGEVLLEALQDCQQAAIVVGEKIEQKVSEDREIVPMLEKYCEKLFELAQLQQEGKDTTNIEELSYLIGEVAKKIEQLQGVYQIVFMPYKADMWDSLESIWKAFRKDERCECIVMPIPYFCYDGEKQEWKPAYDGELFPKDVVVMDYRAYSVKEEQPDMAFIHNPYDKYNWVTNVHPDYYSYELKKHVGKLVYVPYYVTSGKISDKHLALSAYEHMDYMIAQSEYFKETCKGMFYYDKVLPLGSPKFDRVIQKCAQTIELEPEWAEVLQGKKSLMLNTSIRCFLLHGEVYLQKLWNLFREVKKRNDIVIIWRPHPLLEATIASLRSGVREEFEQLKKFFIEEKIGIFDRTSDITRTIAIVDGYIGEAVSSVVHLFGAAGKPIFVLRNYITAPFEQEQKRHFSISDMHQIDGKWWMISRNFNGIFCSDGDWENIEFVNRIENQPKWAVDYYYFAEINRHLVFSPMCASTPVIVDLESGKQTELLSSGMNTKLYFKEVFGYKDKIFFLPAHSSMLLEYNTATGRWKTYKDCITKLKESSKRYDSDIYFEVAAGKCAGKYLWLVAEYTNQLLRFDMENGQASLVEIGDEELGFCAIEVDGDVLWLGETHTGNIIAWNYKTNQTQLYRAPENLTIRKNVRGRESAYSDLCRVGNYLIGSPSLSNGMVKLDVSTGESKMLIPEFGEKAEQICNDYHPGECQTSIFMKELDEGKVIVQRECDRAAAIIDVATEEYEVVYPSISQQSYERFMDGQDGFEKQEDISAFYRTESRMFSLEDFLDDVVNERLEDVKKRQKEELIHMGANLDGTCGEKVHEYMMNVLEKGQE